ncbi:MAG: radical SAM family heme chaperone HemW [Cyanobacteria bacterium RUI128]|nr:radical SAM family heme chaperone HemW [Cyanobacteria bacterium RUI128]
MISSPTSAYIHIPFCKSKCKYCSFVSFENQDKKTGYIFSLLKEIDHYYNTNPLKTLYIGGGTPSVVEVEYLKKIINKLRFEPDAEITIEVNPNDVTPEYMSELKSLGFNRLSMGAQTFDDNILKIIGRRHNSDEIYKAVETAKSAGFENISLDLIYGLPTQTVDGFRHDLEEIIKLDTHHISLYGLKIEEGCYFYNHLPDNIPDDDTQADMYLLAGELTTKNGYEHYEISNYSKKGFRSKHNTNYWKCGEYYGFGLSAHGYVDGIRYANPSVLEEYLASPLYREYGKFLTKQEMLEEKIFLGLRLAEGIDISEINENFGTDFDEKYKNVIKKYTESGHLIKTESGYKFSDDRENNGFLLSNIILSEFI